jgi:hypothetical protein
MSRLKVLSRDSKSYFINWKFHVPFIHSFLYMKIEQDSPNNKKFDLNPINLLTDRMSLPNNNPLRQTVPNEPKSLDERGLGLLGAHGSKSPRPSQNPKSPRLSRDSSSSEGSETDDATPGQTLASAIQKSGRQTVRSYQSQSIPLLTLNIRHISYGDHRKQR